MNKITQGIVAIIIILTTIPLIGLAQLPALTDQITTFPMGTVFNGQSGYIDINTDNTNDYYVTYYSSGTIIYYRIEGVNSNQVMVEYTYPSLGNSGSKALSPPSPIPMVKLYGPNELVGASITSPGPLTVNSGEGWSSFGYLTHYQINAPLTASSASSSSGYMGAALTGGYYGWAYFTGLGTGPFTYASAAATSTPGSITTPGATVPVPFIASLLAMLAIGGGVYFKRRKK